MRGCSASGGRRVLSSAISARNGETKHFFRSDNPKRPPVRLEILRGIPVRCRALSSGPGRNERAAQPGDDAVGIVGRDLVPADHAVDATGDDL